MQSRVENYCPRWMHLISLSLGIVVLTLTLKNPLECKRNYSGERRVSAQCVHTHVRETVLGVLACCMLPSSVAHDGNAANGCRMERLALWHQMACERQTIPRAMGFDGEANSSIKKQISGFLSSLPTLSISLSFLFHGCFIPPHKLWVFIWNL